VQLNRRPDHQHSHSAPRRGPRTSLPRPARPATLLALLAPPPPAHDSALSTLRWSAACPQDLLSAPRAHLAACSASRSAVPPTAPARVRGQAAALCLLAAHPQRQHRPLRGCPGPSAAAPSQQRRAAATGRPPLRPSPAPGKGSQSQRARRAAARAAWRRLARRAAATPRPPDRCWDRAPLPQPPLRRCAPALPRTRPPPSQSTPLPRRPATASTPAGHNNSQSTWQTAAHCSNFVLTQHVLLSMSAHLWPLTKV